MPVFRLNVHFMPYLFNNSTKEISCFIVLENGQEIKQEVAYADGNSGTASKSARDFRGNMIREEILTKKKSIKIVRFTLKLCHQTKSTY